MNGLLFPRSFLLVLSLCFVACTLSDRDPGGRTPLDSSLEDGGSVDGGSSPRNDARVARSDAGFVACETTTAFADPLPATLLFNIDTSGSMNYNAATGAMSGPTPAPDDSRYDVFRIVLQEALAGLPDSTLVGIMRYPDMSICAEDGLLVDIDRLSVNRAIIGTTLAAVVPHPNAITPTHDAVLNAIGRLRARSADEARFQVLATDGAATVCVGCDTRCTFEQQDLDDEMLVEDVRRAAEEGIRTFVIGVPGSRPYQHILSRMASAAGTARAGCSDDGPTYCHFDLTESALDFGMALRDALAAIGDVVLSCEYNIPPNPDGTFDPMKVNVSLTHDDGTRETIHRDSSRASGWDYSDDRLRIELHGEACTQARNAHGGRIDVLFGCPTVLF